MVMTTPAARNAHGGEKRSYVIPTSSGPVRRPSAASDCAAPSIAPCSVGSANTEISPVAAGDPAAVPHASTVARGDPATAADGGGGEGAPPALPHPPAHPRPPSQPRRRAL